MGMSGWDVIADFMNVLKTEGRRAAIYRGQPDEKWTIVPSAYRDGVRGIVSDEQLRHWVRDAARFASPMPGDPIEWLILAQHYGVPTNMLDWTTSPLVALFFACDDPTHKAANGCVWRMMRPDFLEARDTSMIHPFGDPTGPARQKPFLVNAIGRNARSTAQEGILTLHTPHDYQTLNARNIFTVESDMKYDVLQCMEKLGLTSYRLYNDIGKFVECFQSQMIGQRFPGWP